jgi:hypothetical protein
MARHLRSIEAGLKKELLCVHIEGPDDIEACDSLESGEKRARELNAVFDSWEKTKNTPEARAVIKAWPYSAEDHAKDLTKPK